VHGPAQVHYGNQAGIVKRKLDRPVPSEAEAVETETLPVYVGALAEVVDHGSVGVLTRSPRSDRTLTGTRCVHRHNREAAFDERLNDSVDLYVALPYVYSSA
jgi:hypothetical protein